MNVIGSQNGVKEAVTEHGDANSFCRGMLVVAEKT
jgi:hypothetical protein